MGYCVPTPCPWRVVRGPGVRQRAGCRVLATAVGLLALTVQVQVQVLVQVLALTVQVLV